MLIREILKEETGQTFYHVTFKSRLKAIKSQGLEPGHKRLWKNTMGKNLGSRNHVYLFGNLEGAVRWAHKMEYDLGRPVAILSCIVSEPLEPDPNIQVQSGQAMLSQNPIPPEAITGVIYPDVTLYRQVVNGRTITQQPTWSKL